MSTDRRRHPRLAQPFDASWSGASGGSACRIADISWGGCFITTLAEPSKGERAIVTISVGYATITVEGRVASVDRPMGFAVEFDPLTTDQIAALSMILGDPPPSLSCPAGQ